MSLSPSNHHAMMIMSIRRCPKKVTTVHDDVRNPHNVRLPHEQLHAALSRVKQSRITVPDSLHGRAFEQEVPLIMYSMQGARLAQAPVPWDTRTLAMWLWVSLHAAIQADVTLRSQMDLPKPPLGDMGMCHPCGGSLANGASASRQPALAQQPYQGFILRKDLCVATAHCRISSMLIFKGPTIEACYRTWYAHQKQRFDAVELAFTWPIVLISLRGIWKYSLMRPSSWWAVVIILSVSEKVQL